jgi:alpha-1,3-rhamnosyl/mannosyltransferase
MADYHTILFDARTATSENPGLNRYIRSLLSAMLPLLHEDERLHVILPPDTEIAFLDHCQVVTHPTEHNFNTFRSHRQTFRLEHRIKPQVYHAPCILTPLRVPGKLVLTMHGFMPAFHPEYSSNWHTQLFWKLNVRRVLAHCRKLITVSEEMRKVGLSHFGGARAMRRSTVIHPGIDPSFRVLPAEQVADARKKHSLPDKFLLYFGSDRPHKNVATLLRALALTDPTASVPLVIAGYGNLDSPLRREAEHLGLGQRVLWFNDFPEEDLPALYCAAHVLLFPSLVEGFAFPVLEAMACGTPVICSALNTLKEFTAGAAKIVHPTDCQEWQRAIDAALVSLDWHDVYSRKALDRAAAFSWPQAAAETLEVYRQLYGCGFTSLHRT